MHRNRAKVAAEKEERKQREGTVAPDTEAVSWWQTRCDFVNGDRRPQEGAFQRAQSSVRASETQKRSE